MKFRIYTDGAYAPTINQGGIGFVVLKEDKKIFEYSKMFKNTTNNRMEQMACIVALESIKNPSEIDIVTDSMYVVGTYTLNWKRKKNIDLWERFDKAISKHIKVNFKWVKGHDRDKYNNECDKLAQEASKEL